MIAATDINSLYSLTLNKILTDGEVTHPRGFTCYELYDETLWLQQPQYNIITHPVRRLSKGFLGAELIWMLGGRNDVATIKPFNRRIGDYSDDGETFYGAYGPRIADQLPYVLRQLEEDPWTRQAVMTTWQPSPAKTKDVPCTVMFHFMRRPLDTLNLIVYMRSNDAWLGLPYDIHNFTSIQLLMAGVLGLKVGTYTHHVGSLHLYEKHLELARVVAEDENHFGNPETPIPRLQLEDNLAMHLSRANLELMKMVLNLEHPETFDENYNEHKGFNINNLLDQKLLWMLGHLRKQVAA